MQGTCIKIKKYTHLYLNKSTSGITFEIRVYGIQNPFPDCSTPKVKPLRFFQTPVIIWQATRRKV